MDRAPIKTLDLADFYGNPLRQAHFVAEFSQAMSETGFFFLENHGISEYIIQDAFGILPRFFKGLSEEARLGYERPDTNGQIGYTKMRGEKGEFSKIPDEKHYWHVPQDPALRLYVREVPEFARRLDTLMDHFEDVSGSLMQAAALSLDLEEDYFDVRKGDSLLRAIHYPAQKDAVGVPASAHTDINMLTLLLPRSPGLMLLHEDQWLPVTIDDPNVIVVNGGDMLWHLTGGRYRSGMHRVDNLTGEERFSIVHFGHVAGDSSLVPLESLGPSDLERFSFKTAGEFLDHRLKQLGHK